MRAVFGLLLVMLGLAMAVVWMPEHDSARQLAVVTDIATQGSTRRSDAADRTGRTFSPSTPLIAMVEQPGASQPHHIAGVARVVRGVSGSEAGSLASIPNLQPSNSTIIGQSIDSATVVAPPQATTSGTRLVDPAAASRSPSQPEPSRYELVRTLQRELKRVGCYAGDIDGDWGTGSRRAMAAFTDRVNASLPIEQPDFILLTLVQGQQGSICGKGCPAGQTVADNGRCAGSPVVAEARRGQFRQGQDSQRPDSSRQDRRNSTISTDVVQYTSTQTATAPPPQDAGWTTQVTRGAISSTSSAAPAGVAAAAVAIVAAAAAPQPGRMAMGGPPVPSGAIAAPVYERSPARSAVRIEPPQADSNSARPAQSVERRQRARRTARNGGSYRSGAMASRSLRITPPTYYASAPRRGRSWTSSFFGFP